MRVVLYVSIINGLFACCDTIYQGVLWADSVRHVAEYERYNLVLDLGVANEADWAWLHSGICADDTACAEVDAVERLQ